MAESMIAGVEQLLATVGERLEGDDSSDTSDQIDTSDIGAGEGSKWSDRGSEKRMSTQLGTTHARNRLIKSGPPART
jgi:hypothetical protein